MAGWNFIMHIVMARSLMFCIWLLFATSLSVPAQPRAFDKPAAQGSATDSSSRSQSDQSSLSQTYLLGPEDVLEIRVFNRPQLSRDSVRIDERGMIRMPLIANELQASCRTAAQLAGEITLGYAKYLRNPQVDVFVKEYQSQPVAVVGAVNDPGRFQLRRPVRLLELLTYAGGPSEKGGRQVQVVHAASAANCEMATEDSRETAATLEAFDLTDTLRGDEKANPYVRPGDVITVPEALQAFIVGNVMRPMAITLKEPTTISQAIAMAGGTMPDTKSDRVRVVRQTKAGRTEILVNLKAIASRRSEDTLLQANDIIEVPTSAGKRFLRSLTSAIAPAVGRLPVRVIP